MKVQECSTLQVEEDPKGRTPWQLSRDFQLLLRETRGGRGDLDLSAYPDQLTESLREQIEAIHVELAELLDHLPWKSWKTYSPNHLDAPALEEVKFEAIDLLFFLNNIFISLGMDDAEIQRYYYAKYQENVRRQSAEYSKPKAK